MSCIGCGGFSNRPEKIKVHCFACCQVTGSLSVQEQQLQIAAREVALIQAEMWWRLCHWPTFGCVSCGLLCTGNAKHCSLGRMGACTVCDIPNFFLGGLMTLSLWQTSPLLQLFSSLTTLHNVTFRTRWALLASAATEDPHNRLGLLVNGDLEC